MNSRETSADVTFEYTGVGCSVPKDITSVRVAKGLQKIEEVTLNNGLLGNGAFINCKSLESITLPSTVTEIGQGAFHG